MLVSSFKKPVMEIELPGGKRLHFCDVCGDSNPDLVDSSIRVDFTTEDDCFGSGNEFEEKLWKEHREKDEGEAWSALREYALHPEIAICHGCRHDDNFGGPDSDLNFFNRFEREVRLSRARILTQNLKLLPEFNETADMLKTQLEEAKAKEKSLAEKLVTHAKEGRPTSWIIDDLVKLRLRQIKLSDELNQES